ncbi:MAG: carbonic anhydrase [Cyclobacteriaceae bacterium]|nr:carbonic anhydrase [Cyclobacteriaceae bacterium]
MRTQTKEIQQSLTPSKVKQILVDGNQRFVQNKRGDRDLKKQVNETSTGQFPMAVVLGCIDSRVPAELVFDRGIGDIFNARVAGNIVNEDILGSIEYGCKVAGSKLVVVLGHTKCGAVAAACQNVELGNITALLSKIKPAVDAVRGDNSEKMDEASVEQVAVKNVQISISNIRKESPILAEMEEAGEIEIVGAIYSVSSGQVEFI